MSGQTPKGVDARLTKEGTIPWFKVGSMNTPGNEHFMNVSSERLSQEDAADLGLRPLQEGAIIFPKRGGAISTNKKRILSRPSCCDLNTMAIVPNTSIAAYVWWWFTGVDLGKLSDGSNVPQINHQDIEPIPVPLPPLSEQRRVVAEVERRLSVVEELEAVVDANLKRAERLRQSILKLAFEGRLVKTAH